MLPLFPSHCVMCRRLRVLLLTSDTIISSNILYALVVNIRSSQDMPSSYIDLYDPNDKGKQKRVVTSKRLLVCPARTG
eukprot:670384-Amphidinium_carterae.1